MLNFRSIALAATGIAVVATAALFTVSLTLVAGGAMIASMAIRMLMPRPKQQPVYARSRGEQREMRVWNDGRGTIIDL